MNDLLANVILVIIIGACALAVVIGIVKTIGIEYRKTSEYAANVVSKAIEEIPEVTKKTMEMLDKYQEEKKDKALRQAWEEEKRKNQNPTMSCKDEPGWGIM